MRTGRSLTVCCSLLPGREGGLLPGGSVLGGSAPGGSPCLGGCLPARGVSPCPGGSPCPETPPVNRITDTCKNITLATTSLQPVISTCRYVEENGLAALMAAKSLAGVTPEVNHIHVCWVWIRPPTLALKPWRDITRSPKQKYQWPPKKGYALQKLTMVELVIHDLSWYKLICLNIIKKTFSFVNFY